MLSIWARFSELPDPRTGNAQRHNLLDVLAIALTATICGAESCVDFADFARDREALFRDFLELISKCDSPALKHEFVALVLGSGCWGRGVGVGWGHGL